MEERMQIKIIRKILLITGFSFLYFIYALCFGINLANLDLARLNLASLSQSNNFPTVQEDVTPLPAIKFAPDRIIVKLKSGKNLQTSLSSLNAKYKVKNVENIIFSDKNTKMLEGPKTLESPNTLDAKLKQRAKRKPKNAVVPKLEQIYSVKVDPKTDILSMVAEYKKNPNIEYAEPDYEVKVQMIPNDPYYSSSGSWGQPYSDLWGLKKLDTEHAWDITQGAGIVVAVIDTGVDYNHSDLAQNIWVNPNEIPADGVDNDNNDYVDDVKGWDFAYGDNNPMDGHGHGTHVSGTVAAVGNNNLGVIGVAPQAKIMAIKGLDDAGSGYTSDLANAIIYATDNGADILNNSWGGGGDSQVLTDAFHYAYSKGVVAIAAAGNYGQDASIVTPANIDTVIAVASTDRNDAKSSFSNYGYKVDVAAPGENILSLRSANTDIYGGGTHIVNTNYYYASGTSMASPHVAGEAALLLANFPSDSNGDIRRRIMTSADPFPIASSFLAGTGRINTYKALISVPAPFIQIQNTQLNDITDGDQIPESGEQIQLTITLKNIWKNASSVTATLSSTDPSIASIPTNASNFGSMAQDEMKSNSISPFIFKIGQIQFEKSPVFTLTVNADGIIKTLNFQAVLGVRFLNLPTQAGVGWGSLVHISSDKIVWVSLRKIATDYYGPGGIYLYDLAIDQTRKISDISSVNSQIAIDGDKIVWDYYPPPISLNGNADIYLYDLTTNQEKKITNDSARQTQPAISGDKIVWLDSRNGGDAFHQDVYLYNLSTNQERRITTSLDTIFNLKMYGDNIVWLSSNDGTLSGGGNDLNIYNLTTNQEKLITREARSAGVFENNIVYTRSIYTSECGSRPNIFLYDLNTNQETQLTNECTGQYRPTIWGDNVVWYTQLPAQDIILYNLKTNQPTVIATQNTQNINFLPNDISGNNIVFTYFNNSMINLYGIALMEIPASIALPDPPVAPSNLTGRGVSLGEIYLAWQDNSNNETGFKIERSSDGVTFTQIANVASGTTSYNDIGLTSPNFYYYRVRATNTGGDSAYSNVAFAAAETSPPAAPSNLIATAVSSSQINLTWQNNSTNEVGFAIERSTSPTTGFVVIVDVLSGGITYQNTGLTASTTYYYRVKAYSGSGSSAYSNIANATTNATTSLAAPSNLTATTASSSQINLTWKDNSTNETGFKIERSTSSTTGFATIALVGLNITAYQNTGLTTNTTYYYRVRAFNTVKNSAYSNVASATAVGPWR